MSVSADDISELLELWAGLNLSAGDHDNLTQLEALLCSGAVSHGALLHVLSVLYAFIFLVGLAANGLVVCTILRCDGSRDKTQLYVLQLAVADLCVVATLPVWVTSLVLGGRWPFGEVVCKLTHLIFSVNLFGSIFFLTCMSVDRYLSVTLFAAAPDSRRKKVVRRWICVLVWLLALAASVPDTYFLQAVQSLHLDGAVCRPVYPSQNPRVWMAGIQLSFIILGFAVPFPVIAVSYLLLLEALPSGSSHECRTNRRVVFTYITVFLACWLPLHAVLLLDTLLMLDVLHFSCLLESFLDVALHLTQCFSLLHCCINPVLYNFLNRNFRYDLMKVAVFKYSTSTGLARLLPTSDTDGSMATMDSVQV